MATKTYLERYRVMLDPYEQPIVLRTQPIGVTYKAFDIESNREVALEVIPAARLQAPRRAGLEAKAAAARQIQHINVPRLYDFGIEDDELIYAFEMAHGTTLQQWVQTQGPLPLTPVLRVGAQVVSALGAAAFHGVFHPALQPRHIMIVPGAGMDGAWPLIKVTDFLGPAPTYSAADASVATVEDAVNFVSPEQIAHGTVDFGSAIYSLGCTLWFLLSGVPPLAGAATVESAGGLPAEVRRLFAQLLAHDPLERPLDPVILREKFDDCLAGLAREEAAAPVEPIVAPTLAPRRPFPWQPFAVAAALLALAGLGAMLLPGRFHSFLTRGDNRAIGIPIGVPPAVAEAAAITPGTEPDASPVAVENRLAMEKPAPTMTPVEIVSVPAPEPEATAQILAKAEPPTPPPVILPEPASPSEGPAVAESTPAPFIEETRPPEPAVALHEEVRKAEPVTANDLEAPKDIRPASHRKNGENRQSRMVASHASRELPRASVQPRFLGTTPEGEAVFGLPPGAHPVRKATVSRQDRTVIYEPTSTLPVLPALPPDQ